MIVIVIVIALVIAPSAETERMPRGKRADLARGSVRDYDYEKGGPSRSVTME